MSKYLAWLVVLNSHLQVSTCWGYSTLHSLHWPCATSKTRFTNHYQYHHQYHYNRNYHYHYHYSTSHSLHWPCATSKSHFTHQSPMSKQFNIIFIKWSICTWKFQLTIYPLTQDLTFVQIGNPDLTDGKINFAKRWQQFNILVSIIMTEEVPASELS